MMKQQIVLGRDLILRSLAFQVAFMSAAAVAGRIGPQALAAHQILLQLWNFLTLVLDSLAIAAQTLIGAAVGAGSVMAAKQVGQRILAYSTGFALVLAAVFGAGFAVIPRIFTTDAATLAALSGPWWQFGGHDSHRWGGVCPGWGVVGGCRCQLSAEYYDLCGDWWFPARSCGGMVVAHRISGGMVGAFRLHYDSASGGRISVLFHEMGGEWYSHE